MAGSWVFGNTNNVDQLNIGLRGASDDTGSVVKLIPNSVLVSQQLRASAPQENFTAVQVTGAKSRTLTARGYLVAPNHATMNTYEDRLTTAANSNPSRMVNNVTGRTLDSVKLVRWNATSERRTTDGTKQLMEIEIEFEQLSP